MPLSPADKLIIAARAATIYERAASVTRAAAAASSAPDPSARAAIRAWIHAFSEGDEPAFLERLKWDGLDLATVLASAGDPGPPASDVAWLDWLDRTSQAAEQVAAEVRSGRFVADPLLEIPFEEIWRAFRRAAADALGPPSAPRTITAPAIAAFERQLCLELTRQGELALFDEFRRAADVDPSPGGPPDRYRAFVVGLLEQGLAPFFVEYAALARRLADLARDWVDATREFLDRLAGDQEALASRFGAGLGAVASIEPGVSDPHHGRRRVAILRFESGRQVVYKPRSLQADVVFNQFVEWMNTRVSVPPRVLAVLDRGSYGWVEFARHEPVADRADASRYFRRTGALMCAAFVLGARDLHLDNVVATESGPALVDTEMLLQPISRTAAQGDEAPDSAADVLSEESVLSTGLVSLVEVTSEGEVYDSGALRGQVHGPLPFPSRAWRALRTDGLHFVEEPSFRTTGRHLARLEGVALDPGDYADEILAGFSEAYRSLLDRRAELLSPDGPLRAFAGSSARVLLRPTNQYAMLTSVLSKPRYQRSGVAGSTAVDILHRAWAGAVSRPEHWVTAIAERRAIARLDVPYFSARPDGTDLRCDGRVVAERYFAVSGLDAAIARVESLSLPHLEAQAARLSRALGEPVTARFAQAAPSVGRGPDNATSLAVWIGREVISRAVRTADGLTWPYLLQDRSAGWSAHRLYDGTLGPALLLAGLAAVRGDEEWRGPAADTLRPLQRALERQPLDAAGVRENIGAADGLGSLVYGLTVASALLDDLAWLDLARVVAARIGPEIERDTALDVLDGAAGAALALLALFEASGDRDALRLAVACGDHLLRAGVADRGGGRALDSGPILVGFAHGAAGIASALARLYRTTGDERFREAAAAGCRFVADQFLPTAANYAIAGPDSSGRQRRRSMLAWCHGAPGILPGLGTALDISSKTAILSQFDAAMQVTARDEPAQVDHVCCGAFGRVEALLTCGRALDRPDLVGAAWQLADAVTTRAVARGHFRLSGPGIEYRVYDPGFFRGLSGIGYGWLRLAAPDRLPSIAGFEPPGRAGSLQRSIAARTGPRISDRNVT